MLCFHLRSGFSSRWHCVVGLSSLLITGTGNFTACAEETSTPKQGAELLKTDILCVFAHPDDETGAASTLALYARGRNQVVANVYCTRGEGGGNMVGTQGGEALGILREAELRDGLRELGVRYCYFLDRRDWAYTESLAATLEKWNKEQTLERLVRLVRALRPEVMLTMNPAPSPGQHGHHQAAGVLATEAFAAAGDPRRFPAQLHDEGLSVWQPRKLYFAGKSGDVICTIQVDKPMPDGMTPAQVGSRALSNHRSQAFGNFGDSPWLRRPQTFSLIKSFVPAEAQETDLLRGLPVTGEMKEIEVAPPPVRRPIELSFVGRPAINRYRLWVKEQHIEHAAMQFKTDVPLIAGNPNEVQVVIENNSGQSLHDDLNLELPEGWGLDQRSQKLQVDSGKTTTRRFSLTPPVSARGDVALKASISNVAYSAEATGHVVPYASVIRIEETPALDGTDRGWEKAPAMAITPKDLVEGKVASEADSSASFRIAHDSQRLYLDIKVKDDVVVTNIAPNDIKGHWRSDSVEICVDPVGGAEHTFGCFKLGIFPFDTAGVVRAARDADAKQGLVEETAPGTRLASWRTDDGYRIQASIPFSELGLDYLHKRLFGFNLIIYDGDKANAAIGENINKSRIAWSPRPGVQGRPEDWGRLRLQ